MAISPGVWYVRFPDGRVVLAKSTQAVRYHIERGRIPANSRVRRSSEENWLNIDAAPEFADLLGQPASDNGREPGDSRNFMNRSTAEFRVFGVAVLVNELFSAVDLSLHRNKLWAAGSAALVAVVGIVGLDLVFELANGPWLWGPAIGIAVVMLLAASLAGSALGQMTLVEMLRRRRARWDEVRPRLTIIALRIFLGEVLFLAIILLPIEGLRLVPGLWGRFAADEPPEVLLSFIQTLTLILEIVFWPLQGMMLVLGPILIVEECSLPRALATWWELVRGDLSRIFLYEALAVALGAVLTLPLIAPILFVAWDQGAFLTRHLTTVSQTALLVLGGLALTPLAAYLLVANVFIYLNLRYEFYSPKSGQ